MSENLSKLSGRKGLKDNLFKEVSALSKDNAPTDQSAKHSDAKKALAERFLVGKSTVHGANTFYDFFDEQHLNKKAFVCNGSACLCAGTQDAIIASLETSFASEDIGHICCLGRCHETAAFQIGNVNYSGSDITQLDKILSDKNPSNESYQSKCHAKQSFLIDKNYSSIEQAKSVIKNVIGQNKKEVLDAIKLSGLRGRGGAGFPTGIKWESCAKIIADQKFVVCNADEGDPGAYSDRYLMEQQSYRVILGMIICAHLVGAEEGAIYIRAEYPESIAEINRSIELFTKNNLLGEKILGQNFNFELYVIDGAGAYICGEETALIASIEGRRAEVDVRPPFPTEQGLFKKPTALNNVETFAAIPAILDKGGETYAGIGVGRSLGTKLVSLDKGFNKPGIYEVALGLPLQNLIEDIGGGFARATKAIHIGGPLGGLVPTSEIPKLTFDFESFSENGFLLGHASFVCIPEEFPLINYISHLFEFTAMESCGKCFPCRLGSTRGKEMLQQAIEGQKKLDHTLLEDLLNTLEQGSLCALGGGLPLPIKNALNYFNEELSPYFD